ncbi:cytochrome P450 [Rhodofomes roseus]|uniref:Cytochrome P450 n=1 Tax=Rhodofomes roseus TaxID=34475 RepID=A0ABQ8KM05_9APHY|nr:cytochrome P450 [Rhodofomes roseus]KAH9838661.1 cytochrome P450 [Rhodofomes roseus]
MSFQLMIYSLAAFTVLYIVCALLFGSDRRLSGIPSVGGPSLPVFSYIGVIRSLANAPSIIHEGYTKHKGRSFKFAEAGHWRVLLTSPEAVEELARAPEDVLSFPAAANDSIQVEYTLGPNIARDAYHIPLIRNQLVRNAPRMMDDIRDEVVCAFRDEMQPRDGWISVQLKDVSAHIVCRVINRVFVGLPLCTDPDYLAVNTGFMMNVVLGGALIKLFPSFLKPFVAKFCTNIPASIDRVVRHLEPIITERLRVSAEGRLGGQKEGNGPNDMLQWLIESAPDGPERTVPALALRVLVVNFAALHTTSTMLTHTLYYLAAHPEHAAFLRDEVERVVQDEGWSKAALGNMRLVDSFLKEVGRVTGLGAISVNRKALQDFTFLDGTFVPKGTFVAAAARPIHWDEEHYANPEAFDPWRFANMSNRNFKTAASEQLVKTNDHYLLFGHGRHACPGRFFAATLLKLILAHVVTTYDVKFADSMDAHAVPPPTWVSVSMIPNRKAKVLFCERRSKH